MFKFLNFSIKFFIIFALICLFFAFSTLWYFSIGLPDYKKLSNYQPPISSRVYSDNGKLIAEYALEKRLFIPFESIPRLGSIAGVDLYLICHDRKKTLSLQNQMIQDIEVGHIDKKLIELSAQRIIDFKKEIPPTSPGKENLSDLTRGHVELIREMKSHLL